MSMSLSRALLKNGKADVVWCKPDPNTGIHKYVLIKLLAEGGQSRVWFALVRNNTSNLTKTTNNEPLAIKQYDFDTQRESGGFTKNNSGNYLQTDTGKKNRMNEINSRYEQFKYEISLLERLKTFNLKGALMPISCFYDAQAQRGYIVSRYIDTPVNLDVYLNQLTNRQLLTAMIRVAKTLHGLYKTGVVHGDIKPRNILWNRNTHETFLIDFGSSQFYLPDLPMNTHVGTIPYRAPELVFQTCGDTLRRSADIWSLGCTFLVWMFPDLRIRAEQANTVTEQQSSTTMVHKKDARKEWEHSVVNGFFRGNAVIATIRPRFRKWRNWIVQELGYSKSHPRMKLLKRMDTILHHMCCINVQERYEAKQVAKELKKLKYKV